MKKACRQPDGTIMSSHNGAEGEGSRAMMASAGSWNYKGSKYKQYIRLCNTLSMNVTSASSISVFRKRSKTHLFSHSFPESPVQWLVSDTIIDLFTYLLTYLLSTYCNFYMHVTYTTRNSASAQDMMTIYCEDPCRQLCTIWTEISRWRCGLLTDSVTNRTENRIAKGL